MYNTFLFDADNTLYDFDAACAHALEVLLAEHEYLYTPAIFDLFVKIGTPLWQSLECGKLSDVDLQRLRMTQLFAELGLSGDPLEFNARFLHELGRGEFYIEGALDICEKIVASGKRLYIVTNGFLATYESRVKHLALEKFVTECFVSEVIGHKKPSREFFDHVFARISPVDKGKVLLVGDSLTADIAGGIAAGVDTCWFNMYGVENVMGVVPTYEIRSLWEVEEYINV